MKNILIIALLIVLIGAIIYLIIKVNKPVAPPIVEVTTPPATVVQQPVYIVRERNRHNQD